MRTLFLFAAVFLAACAGYEETRETFAFGTLCRIKVFEKTPAASFDAVFRRVAELENIFSANRAESDLERVNAHAGIEPVAVPPELFAVLSRALEFAALSADDDGCAAFDPTIGPLVKLWNIGGGDETVPPQDAIDAARALVDWRSVELDAAHTTVLLKNAGMRLDLGGIAKGYAADEAVRVLRDAGVPAAIVDFGGNISALGVKRGGAAFNIGVQDPRGARGGYIGIVTLSDASAVTSGDYERSFEAGGVRYHHIFSSRTGFPAHSGVASVTVIAPRSIDADALSTAVFVLGIERGSVLLAAHDAQSVVVFDDGKIQVSDGLRAAGRWKPHQ